jgi:hypothetical protein
MVHAVHCTTVHLAIYFEFSVGGVEYYKKNQHTREN